MSFDQSIIIFLFAKTRVFSTLQRIAGFIRQQAQASFIRRVLAANAVMTEKTAREELAHALQVFQVSGGLLPYAPLRIALRSFNATCTLQSTSN